MNHETRQRHRNTLKEEWRCSLFCCVSLFSSLFLSLSLSLFFPYHLNGSSLCPFHPRSASSSFPFLFSTDAPPPSPRRPPRAQPPRGPPFRFAPTSTATTSSPARSTDRPIRYPRGSFATNPPDFASSYPLNFPPFYSGPRKHLRRAFLGKACRAPAGVTRPRCLIERLKKTKFRRVSGCRVIEERPDRPKSQSDGERDGSTITTSWKIFSFSLSIFFRKCIYLAKRVR